MGCKAWETINTLFIPSCMVAKHWIVYKMCLHSFNIDVISQLGNRPRRAQSRAPRRRRARPALPARGHRRAPLTCSWPSSRLFPPL